MLVIYQKIGPAGLVLLILSFMALYFSIKNIVLLSIIYRDFRKRFAKIESGEEPYSKELHNPGNPLIGLITEVVETHATHSNDIRAEVAYLFHRNFEQVNRDITWLKLISVIAPLLGLLGTMLGMIAVFQELAAGTGGANAATLANGIWEALITTIMGLTVAVPTLIAFYFLSLKMKGFHIEAIEHSYRAVDLFLRNCPHADEIRAAKPRMRESMLNAQISKVQTEHVAKQQGEQMGKPSTEAQCPVHTVKPIACSNNNIPLGSEG